MRAHGFGFPTTDACFNPQSFLLSRGARAPRTSAEAQRPMDAKAVRAGTPQEDEFALFCLSAPSPYEALLFPKGIARVAERSNPNIWSAGERAVWIARFRQFAGACTAADRPLVVKSPSHSFRIPLLRAIAISILADRGSQPAGNSARKIRKVETR